MSYPSTAALPVAYDQEGSSVSSYSVSLSPQSVSRKDALRFEEAISNRVGIVDQMSPSAVANNSVLASSQAEAVNLGEVQELKKMGQKKVKNVTKTLGEVILNGLTDSSNTLDKAYRDIHKLIGHTEKLSVADVFKMQMSLLEATVSVDFATRVVSKVATSVDSLLRLQ